MPSEQAPGSPSITTKPNVPPSVHVESSGGATAAITDPKQPFSSIVTPNNTQGNGKNSHHEATSDDASDSKMT